MALTQVNSVERVIVLRGEGDTMTLYKSSKKKKKKQSTMLKPLEKAQRRMAKAMASGSQSYLDRHQASNRKKKNGWLRDLSKNQRKAMRRGIKKLRKKN